MADTTTFPDAQRQTAVPAHPRTGPLLRLAVAAALLVSALAANAVAPRPADAAPPEAVLEAESMSLPSWAGTSFSDAAASGRAGLLLWANSTATGDVHIRGGAAEIAVTARADRCDGGARMTVSVAGSTIGSTVVEAETWRTYRFRADLDGKQRISLAFTNDTMTPTCDRNLRVDVVRFPRTASTTTTTATTTTTTTAPATTTTTTTTAPTTQNPLAERPLHVASWTAAGAAADQIRTSRPEDAKRLDLLASTPTARWFGEWSGNVHSAVDAYVAEAARAGAMPVIVAYNIPLRDCGSYSGGGAASPDAYRQWIADVAAGIGGRPAAVVLEPDAVALAECLTTTDRATRFQLLSDAIETLAASSSTAVYLDAGHAHWLSADEAANRLRSAGVAAARGISLNVANFGTTTDQVAYAADLHDRLGTRAIIDTSRNGAGSDGTWCNPFGRAIGARPTTETASSTVDAYLWVKVPGESDGTCNGGPPAGEFWIDYAVDLVRNAEMTTAQ